MKEIKIKMVYMYNYYKQNSKWFGKMYNIKNNVLVFM